MSDVDDMLDIEEDIAQDIINIKHEMRQLYNDYVLYLNYKYEVFFNDIVTLNGYDYKVVDVMLPSPELLNTNKKPTLLVERISDGEKMVIRDWTKCTHLTQ